jgi:hypothetical protein
MSKVKDAQPTRYGIWREKTERHGWCWCYQIRVVESDGKMHRRARSGFKTKDEAEAAVAALRMKALRLEHGLVPPQPVHHPTIKEAVENYIKVIMARWEARHGEAYAARNAGQINALRNWMEFAGPDRRVDSITRDDFIFWQQHESKRGLSQPSIRRRINSIRAAINHARENHASLVGFAVPRRPTGEDANRQRMRILDADEIRALSDALAARPQWRDALDFFVVAL